MLLLVGILLDKYKTKNLLLFGFVISIIGTLIFASSSSFIISVLGRVIAGFGHAFALLSCFRVVVLLLPTLRQASVMGLIITIALIGGFLAQTPTEYLSTLVGWRHTIYLQVSLGLVIFLLQVLFLPNITQPKRTPASHPGKTSIPKQLIKVCKNSQNWLSGLYICFMSIPMMILGALWGENYLTINHGLSTSQAAFATGMIFIGIMIGSPLVGFISDFLNKRRLIMVCCAFLTFLTLLITCFCNELSFAALVTLFLMIGLLSGAQVLGYSIVAESNPIEIGSTAMGFSNILIMAGVGTVQLIFSAIHGHNANFSFSIILILVLGGGFLAFLIRDPTLTQLLRNPTIESES